MGYRFALAACLLLVPHAARAQQAPERLLSAGTQVYLRWDGIEAHRAAYEQSALGKTLRGDTGKFLVDVLQYVREQLIPLLADQVNPQTLANIGDDGAKFLETVGKHGFVLGVEVRKGAPVFAQATVVFPKAGAPPAPFVSLLRNLAGLGNVEVRQVKAGGRTVQHLDGEFVHALWWSEGEDAVLVIGTDQPSAVLPRMQGKGAGVTAHSLYKQLQDFKEFKTWGRAFVDVAALVKVARSYGPEATQLVDDLGLAGLKSVTFHDGFDGPAERGVLELHVPGPRKGLLRLLNRKTLKFADLPPLPTDLVSVSASNLDIPVTFDVVVQSVESALRLVDPNAAGFFQGALQQIENFLGVKIREDLFGSFGDQVVVYDSPAEGPLGFGQVVLVKVKDAGKLKTALDDLVKAIPNVPGLDLEVKSRRYRGADTTEVHLNGAPGFIYVPTYTIHKGWFAFSYYPQPVHGFILREKGELPAWKPGPDLPKLPDEFVGLSIADPRPRLNLVLSLLPTAAGVLNSFVPQARFDVGIIPNAHQVTRYLFPNVTVSTDDGKKLRIETRSSLALPF